MLNTVVCDIYGCRNTTVIGQTAEVEIDGVKDNIELCDEHLAYFRATQPERYLIGRTFTGEVEVRPVPATSESVAD